MRVSLACAALVSAVVGSAVMPAEPISAATLERYCQAFAEEPSSRAGRLCVLYVRGFVDGVTVSEHPASAESETWTERAARTRLSGRYRERVMSLDTACLTEAHAMGELIARVLERLQSPASRSLNARQVVLEAIRELPPCAG
jgi:hypothetical protein